MPKVATLLIHSCEYCLYFFWSSDRCGRVKPPREVEDPDEIPEWCPLPEASTDEPLVQALKEIASYGEDGICPYGCDTPNIAALALKRQQLTHTKRT